MLHKSKFVWSIYTILSMPILFFTNLNVCKLPAEIIFIPFKFGEEASLFLVFHQ